MRVKCERECEFVYVSHLCNIVEEILLAEKGLKESEINTKMKEANDCEECLELKLLTLQMLIEFVN